MIINKESLKKYTSDEAVLANLEKFTKRSKFQEVDDFIKTHKELPEAHFLNKRVCSDTTPFLIVHETKTQIKAMRIEAFAISGTAEMDDIKYAYMVDVDFYEEQKASKFQDCTKIIKNSDGTLKTRNKWIHFYKCDIPFYFRCAEF